MYNLYVFVAHKYAVITWSLAISLPSGASREKYALEVTASRRVLRERAGKSCAVQGLVCEKAVRVKIASGSRRLAKVHVTTRVRYLRIPVCITTRARVFVDASGIRQTCLAPTREVCSKVFKMRERRAARDHQRRILRLRRGSSSGF